MFNLKIVRSLFTYFSEHDDTIKNLMHFYSKQKQVLSGQFAVFILLLHFCLKNIKILST